LKSTFSKGGGDNRCAVLKRDRALTKDNVWYNTQLEFNIKNVAMQHNLISDTQYGG